MKKARIRLTSLFLALLFALALFPFALAADEYVTDYRIVYDLKTGETRIVDLNHTTEHITIVHVSFSDAEGADDPVSPNAVINNIYKGNITYTITDSIVGNSKSIVECRYTNESTITSSNPSAWYSWQTWNFKRIDDSVAYGATYTMYDKGYERYENALLVDYNDLAAFRWGTMGKYGLANYFYASNPEFFGGSTTATATFVYS